MLDFFSTCGVWKLNGEGAWNFVIDSDMGGSLSTISEDISFSNLVETIAEDFGIKDATAVKLSFVVPFKEGVPPMFIRNDRQLRMFVKKLVEFGEDLHLCVTVDEVL